jgi:hypothetical protein
MREITAELTLVPMQTREQLGLAGSQKQPARPEPSNEPPKDYFPVAVTLGGAEGAFWVLPESLI